MKISFNIILLLIWSAIMLGCVKPVDNDNVKKDKAVNVANCNECHGFPGSSMCKADSLNNSSKISTNCSDCHSGSVKNDSSLINTSWAYHDKMIETVDGDFIPETDTDHMNGDFDLDFNQCSKCHGNPPISTTEDEVDSTDGHYIHVVQNGKRCYECHFTTIANTDTIVGDRKIFLQTEKESRTGKMLPVIIDSIHINNHVEIAFRHKFQIAYSDSIGADSSFIWNSTDMSCRNIECHGEPESSVYQKTYWNRD